MINETDNGAAPAQKQEITSQVTTNSPEVIETAEEEVNEETKPEVEKPEVEKKRERPGKAEREIARLRAENEALKSPKAQSNGADKPKRPQEKDFDGDVWAYNLALVDWAAENKVQEKLDSYKLEERLEKERADLEPFIEAHDEREDAFIEQNPDYADKINIYRSSGLLTDVIHKEVLKSNMSEQVAYYLASFPGDAQTVYQMAQQGNKAGIQTAVKQIEAFLKSQPKADPVKVTQAAAPITPPKSNAGGSTKDVTKMSFQDFINRAAPIK